MVEIIQEKKGPSFGERLSAGVGKGLEMGSQMMKEHKNTQLMSKAGQALLGMDISGFDPDTQKALLVEGLKQRGKGSQQKMLMDFVNQGHGDEGSDLDQGQSSFTDRVMNSGDEPGEQSSMGNEEQMPDQQRQEGAKKSSAPKKYSEKAIVATAAMPGGAATAREMRAHNDAVDNKIKLEEGRKQERERHEELMIDKSQKFNKDFMTKRQDAYKSYIPTKARLEKGKILNESGKASMPATIATFEKLGLPIGMLNNATNEEIEKLSMDLTTGVSDDYRGRILESEFQTFLKRIPQLINSQEGRAQIYENMLALNELKNINYQAYKKVKDQYKDKKLPYDFSDQVMEQEQDALQQWEKSFIERMSRIKVKPGTKISDDRVDLYMSMYDTPEEAEKAAIEDGYVW